ncbi:MAG: MATE family efflux transporter [Rothia sp. (in: high G+C Gram-positive bacteria)]|nr:MATE family efflux transporter [Rothia sp. (in: high G+C Gram-positive bacteria)]
MKINKDHTRYTPYNFITFASTMFTIEVISVGYGAVDLAFISSFGSLQIAAVGLGDLITALYIAFFAGIVDAYATRLSRAEGSSSTRNHFTVLFSALCIFSILSGIFGCILSRYTPLFLVIFESNPGVANIASDYISVRMLGLPFTIILAAISVALRIIGKKNISVSIIFIGFFLNAGFNAIFLYVINIPKFDNPVVAISLATIVVQLINCIIGGIILAMSMQPRNDTIKSQIRPSFISVAKPMYAQGLGVGLRQMNDYAASVVPFILISRLDISVIAASAVAVKIWTIYCRVPQSLLSSAGIFIGYARGKNQQEAHKVAKKSFRIIFWPSIAVALITFILIPFFTLVLGGNNVDNKVVFLLYGAYLIGVPAYIIENFCSEILVVERRAAWLSLPSTVVTYTLTIPLAAIGVIIFNSAFIAILTSALASIILSIVYLRKIHSVGYSIDLRIKKR